MNETILYVEDEEDYQMLVQRILSKKGFQIHMASTAEEGLRALERLTPQLLILDVNLPDANGYALCRELRKRSEWSSLPILLLTVRRRPEEWLKGFSAGADDYVLKPLNPPELEERVQSCLTLNSGTEGQRQPQTEDAEYALIQAAVAGNRAAFEVLVEKYKSRLMCSLKASGRNEVDTEDATAGAFAKAYEQLAEFRGKASFYTWLYRIAFNQRPGQRMYEKTSLEGMEEYIPKSGSKAHPIVHEGREVQLSDALAEIPTIYRQVLTWRFERGFSYDRVAHRLRIPRGTVMSRLSKAKELLRRSWFEADPEHPLAKHIRKR